MKNLLLLFVLCQGYLLSAQKVFKYPIASEDSITDHYFGESITDPYQWMENPTDPRLEEWLKKQARLTKKQANKRLYTWDLKARIGTMYHGVRREKTDAYEEQDSKLKSKYIFKKKWGNYSKSPDLLYKLRGETNYRSLIQAKKFVINKGDHISITSRVINEEKNRTTLNFMGSMLP